MRVSILLLSFSFFLNVSVAQNCDISQAGIRIYNSANTFPVTSVGKGQSAYFRFSIKNLGTDINCTIPSNSITAVLDFPTLAGGIKPYKYDGPASFISGYFTWTYNSDADVLLGTNTTIIPGGEGDIDISVKIKANAYGTGNSNLNITQGKGVSDNISNNFSTAKLIVPKAVNVSIFTASADKCNVLLNWKTLSENNFSHFEVEYSQDGITFINAGRIEGRNIATGADYRLVYTQSNGEGYYRLKQTAIDGSFEYSDVVHVTTDCSSRPSVMVYPNPVDFAQKLIVNISGYSGKITGELFNASGQKISVYNLANKANELSVQNLSAGSYMLYVKDEGREVQSFKIIVTR
jgi:Secretion system C-terminal sorting domain